LIDSADLAFPYMLDYIPAGKRNARFEPVLGLHKVAIRCPDPAQVRTAFRVHIPSSVRRAERNFDILAFEGSLWWPHVLNGSTFDEPLLTADECRAELASGKNDLLGLLGLLADSECDRMPERTIEQIAIRTTRYNGYDAILAIAQRKA
jgi:hypothetical protein